MKLPRLLALLVATVAAGCVATNEVEYPANWPEADYTNKKCNAIEGVFLNSGQRSNDENLDPAPLLSTLFFPESEFDRDATIKITTQDHLIDIAVYSNETNIANTRMETDCTDFGIKFLPKQNTEVGATPILLAFQAVSWELALAKNGSLIAKVNRDTVAVPTLFPIFPIIVHYSGGWLLYPKAPNAP